MKLWMAFLVYGLMALILCAGILLLVTGKPWLFIFALLAYLITFSKVGCLSQH